MASLTPPNKLAAACATCSAVAVTTSPFHLLNVLVLRADPTPSPKSRSFEPVVAQTKPKIDFGPSVTAPEIPSRGSSSLEQIRQAAKSVVKVNLDDGIGSGFIIKDRDRYYVVTNAHVVKQTLAEEIDVTLANGRVVSVDKVSTAPLADIAVLRLKGDGPYSTAALGDSDKIGPGEEVWAIGAPLGLSQSFTSGGVSEVNRDIATLGLETIFGLIQTDAPINPGNSGGPLVNKKGEVIGIISNYINADGIGFSIPINGAKSVVRQLIDKEFAIHGYLGAHIVTPTRNVVSKFVNDKDPKSVTLVPSWVAEARRQVGEHSALVLKVEPNSPAARVGIKPGDFIIRINGQKIVGDGDLRSRIAETPDGQTVELEVVRKDAGSGKFISLTFSVKVDGRLVPQGKPFLATLPPLPNLTGSS